MADHFGSQPSGDALCSVAPEDNFLLHLDDTQAGRPLENALREISESRNEDLRGRRKIRDYWGHRQNPQGLQRR
jgi:hypothetical protein